MDPAEMADQVRQSPTGACGNGGAPGPLAHPGEEGVEAIKVALEVGKVRRGGCLLYTARCV